MSFVELGDICEFLDHKRKPVSEELRMSGPYPYYGANGRQGWIDGYIFDEPLVLLAEDGGHFGSKTKPIAYKISGKTWVNNHAHVLRPRDDCDVDYITHVLSFYDVSKVISGTTRLKLTKGNAELIQIPLPSLPEQQRIAGLLEQADRLRRTRRYALELSDSFLPAAFLELFGDPRTNPHAFEAKPAGELFHIQLGKMLDAKRFTGKELHPYLGNANVQWGYFELNDLKEMDFSAKDFERFKLNPGDILVCEGGEVGRTAIWKGEVADCCYQKALHRLRSKDDGILSVYFLHFMRATVNAGLLAKHATESTIAHFTAEKFEEFPVRVPPLDLQRHFVTLAARHERLHATQREALRQAEHLFQTLLHQAFSPAS